MQLIANFIHRSANQRGRRAESPLADDMSAGCKASAGHRGSRRPMMPNPLCMRDYFHSDTLRDMTRRPHPGCAGVPAGRRPSGCQARQAVENWRWSMVLDMIARKRSRGRRHLAPRCVPMGAGHGSGPRRTDTVFMPTCPTPLLSHAMRSRCFGPSFPTRSGPSFMIRTMRGEKG